MLASGLLRLGAGQAPEPILNAYLVRNPQDTKLVALRGEQQRLREEHALQSATTAGQAVPALQRQLATDLSSAGQSPAVRVNARAWLDRSRASLAAHRELRSAAELRAALAFQRGDY